MTIHKSYTLSSLHLFLELEGILKADIDKHGVKVRDVITWTKNNVTSS
jgi:hypothetical protein